MLRDGVVEALEASGDEARERPLRRVVVDAECHAVAGRRRSVYDGCVLRRASAV